jgi:hypothetical protein
MNIVEFLKYDPETGALVWAAKPNRRIVLGSSAGVKTYYGYVQISVQGKRYFAHKLAWLLMTGEYPECEIDHINGIKDDNRWGNLRMSSPSLNQQNRRAAQKNNKSGLLGVTSRSDGFAARIAVDKKQINLGHYKSADDAHQAYLEAKRKLHPANML